MVLWIDVREIVHRNIGLEIGKDITHEEARELMQMDRSECEVGSDKFERLNDLLFAHDSDVSEGFIDIDISFKEKEQG